MWRFDFSVVKVASIQAIALRAATNVHADTVGSIEQCNCRGMPRAAQCSDTPTKDSTAKRQRTGRVRGATLHGVA